MKSKQKLGFNIVARSIKTAKIVVNSIKTEKSWVKIVVNRVK